MTSHDNPYRTCTVRKVPLFVRSLPRFLVRSFSVRSVGRSSSFLSRFDVTRAFSEHTRTVKWIVFVKYLQS